MKPSNRTIIALIIPLTSVFILPTNEKFNKLCHELKTCTSITQATQLLKKYEKPPYNKLLDIQKSLSLGHILHDYLEYLTKVAPNKYREALDGYLKKSPTTPTTPRTTEEN